MYNKIKIVKNRIYVFKTFFLIIFLFSLPVFAQVSLGDFYKEYLNSQSYVKYRWPPIAYAIDKNYDEFVLLFLKDGQFRIYQIPSGYLGLYSDQISVFEALVLKDKLELFYVAVLEYMSQKDIVSVDEIPTYGSYLTLLQMIAMRAPNPIQVARFLIDLGADPNHFFTGSTPALTWAIYRRNIELAQLLLANGADPNLGSESNLPLYKAVEINYLEGVIFLLNHGAKVQEFMIPVAAQKNSDEILNLLLQSYYHL